MTKKFDSLRRDLERLVEHGGEVDRDREFFSSPAPNAIEWVTRPEYLGAPSLYTHFGAYEAIRDYFELLCPNCRRPGDETVAERFSGMLRAKPRAWLESQPLLVWSNDHQDDVCPKCGVTRYEFIETGAFRGYNQGNYVVGQRSGKSATLAYIGTYVEHFLYVAGHKHGTLQKFFGDIAGAPYEMTFMAASQVQAQYTVWSKFKGTRRSGPWYQRYLPWLAKLQDRQETPRGLPKWEYVEHDARIEHGLFNLTLNSMNSNSATGRGRTRPFVGMDELCHMKSTDSEFSAEENYAAMENSLMTVRARAAKLALPPWLGSIVSISSPRDIDDKGMQLLRAAKLSPRMYTMHRKTEEFAPLTPQEFRLYEDLKRKDPIKYARDFDAQPPAAASPLIPDFSKFRGAVQSKRNKQRAEFREERWVTAGGTRFVGVEFVDSDFETDIGTRVACFDAGRNFDAFAGAAAHVEVGENGEPRTVFDWIWRIVPGDDEEVFFGSVTEMVGKLQDRMPMMQIRFDRWNSLQMMQDLRNVGIEAEIESMPDSAMIDFMRDGYAGLIEMIPPSEAESALLDAIAKGGLEAAEALPQQLSPEAMVYHELMKLERDERDRVYNPRKGKVRGWDSDDLARVVAYCHRLVKVFGYTKKQNDVSRAARGQRMREAAASWDSHFPAGGAHVPGGRGRGW